MTRLSKRKAEESMQIAVMDWLLATHRKVFDLTIHVANERETSPIRGRILKKMGVKRGFPDIFMFYPNQGYHGMAVELKSDLSKKLTDEQRIWLKTLEEQGYYTVEAYGVEDCVKKMDDYIRGSVIGAAKIDESQPTTIEE